MAASTVSASINHQYPTTLSDTPAEFARLPVAAVALVFLPILLSEACLWVMRLADLGVTPVLGQIIYTVSNVVTVGPLVVIARRKGISSGAFGWRGPELRDLGLGVVGFLYGAAVAYPIAAGINSRLGTPIPTHFLALNLAPFPFLIQILYALVIGPFCEETLFRGFAIPRLIAAGSSPMAAGAISLLAFSAMHLPWIGIGGAILILFWGIAPTALYLWRGNIAASTTMHVLNSIWIFFVLPLTMSNH